MRMSLQTQMSVTWRPWYGNQQHESMASSVALLATNVIDVTAANVGIKQEIAVNI
jgi:hypothetical protein